MKRAPVKAAKKTAKKSMHAAHAQKTAPALSSAATGNTSPQGIWSGTISFSLVAIPVRLVRLAEPGRVSFRLLHNKDFSPLKRRMFCPGEEKPVEAGDIIRGFEISPGKHVLVSDEELESVSPERSRAIEISEFIDAAEIDPIYFDHPYFLVPLKGGERSYRLLAGAMKRTNKAGVARFILDEREYLVAVRSTGRALMLNTLHYSAELLSDEWLAPKEAAKGSEVSAMKAKIKDMVGAFKPEKYSDSRREKLMEVLKNKIREKTQVQAPETEEEEPSEGIEDLMSALEESMRATKKGK